MSPALRRTAWTLGLLALAGAALWATLPPRTSVSPRAVAIVQPAVQGPPPLPVPPTRLAPRARPVVEEAPAEPAPVPQEAAPAPPARFTVRGRVLDVDGGGAELAEVHLGPGGSGVVAAVTATDGAFTFESDAAEVLISATADGFAPSEDLRIARPKAGDAQAVLRLARAVGVLEGVVLLPNGAPAARATVRVGFEIGPGAPAPAGASRPLARTVDADEQGRFQFTGLLPGTVPLLVAARGCAVWNGSAEVRGGGTTVVEVRMRRGAALSGRVTLASGDPAEGATVSVTELGGRRMTRTDAAGAYLLADLAAGDVHVAADGGARGSATTTVSVGDEDVRWDPILSVGTAVVGRLTDERGEPLPGWQVRLLAEGLRGVLGGDLRTDAAGRFTFPNRDDGEFEIEFAERRGELPVLRLGAVRATGQEVLFVIRDADRPSAWLEGRVLDSDGQPLGEAYVQVFAANRRSQAYGRSGADGRVRVGPVPAGAYTVTVHVPELATMHVGERSVERGATVDLGDLRFGQPATLVVEFRPLEHAVAGRVTYAIDRRTSSGLQPYVLPRNWTARAEERLAPGDYVLRWLGNLMMTGERAFTVAAGERAALTLDIVRATPHVIIFHSQSRKLARVRYSIRDATGRVVTSENVGCNPAGEVFCAPFLVAGTYSLDASADTGERMSGTLDVAETSPLGEPRRIELR